MILKFEPSSEHYVTPHTNDLLKPNYDAPTQVFEFVWARGRFGYIGSLPRDIDAMIF